MTIAPDIRERSATQVADLIVGRLMSIEPNLVPTPAASDRSSSAAAIPSPSVYLSYAHERQEERTVYEQHKARVFELAALLEDSGARVIIDEWVPPSDGDWPRWQREAALDSDAVVVFVAKRLRERMESAPGSGVFVDGQLLAERARRDGGLESIHTVGIGPHGMQVPNIPKLLEPALYSDLSSQVGVSNLLRRLRRLGPLALRSSGGAPDSSHDRYDRAVHLVAVTVAWAKPAELAEWGIAPHDRRWAVRVSNGSDLPLFDVVVHLQSNNGGDDLDLDHGTVQPHDGGDTAYLLNQEVGSFDPDGAPPDWSLSFTVAGIRYEMTSDGRAIRG